MRYKLKLQQMSVLVLLFFIYTPLNAIVGTTQGEFSVSQGTASYDVKIDVPPGVAGMEPKLSLTYNSATGNGDMGVGWSIGGVSAITRCSQSKAVDGSNHKFGVKYDANDRFCLDGQRLINIKGTYGASGTEYRTEIDTYAKIVSRGTYGSGPRYFDVYTKSGLRYIYGANSTTYEFTKPGQAMKQWKVDRIIDTYNNQISFSYTVNYSQGIHRLNKVTYGGNTVQYNYENRYDVLKGYHGGYPFRIDKRLKEVIVKTGATEVRRYNIGYTSDNSGNRESKVSTITENVKEGDLKKLIFSWQNSDVASFSYKNMNIPQITVSTNSYASGTIKHDKGVQFVDLNADGLKDIIQLFIHKNGSKIRRVYLNKGNTFTYDNSFSSTLPDAYFSDSNGESMGTRLADINADGLIDIIQLYTPDNSYYHGRAQRHVWINTGSGFRLSGYYTSSNMPDAYFTGKDGQDLGTRIADINGDGYVDLIQLYKPNSNSEYYGGKIQRRVFLNTKSTQGFVYNSTYSSNLPYTTYLAGEDGKNQGTKLVDINGDGLVDILRVYYTGTSSRKYIYLNNGRTFDYSSAYTSSLPYLYFSDKDGIDKGTRLADINGDGLVDIIRIFLDKTRSRKYVYLNTGTKFLYNHTYTTSLSDTYFSDYNGHDMGTRLADINGDGYTDIIQMYLPSSRYYGGVAQRRVFLNDGDKFKYDYSYSSGLSDTYFSRSEGRDMGTKLADINGDGLVDILQLYIAEGSYYGGISQRRVYINNNNSPLLTRITNNVDQDIKIVYKDMVDASVYYNYSTHGLRNRYTYNNIANDNIELTIPKSLVYSVNRNNGVSGYNQLKYKYYGYIINKIRGSQGFHSIVTYDDTTKMQSSIFYKQISAKNGVGFQYTGMPYMQYSGRDIGGSWGRWLSQTNIEYRDASTHSKLYEPYTYANIEKVYDPSSKKHLKSIYHYNYLNRDGLGNISKTVDRIYDYVNRRDSRKTTINEYNAESKSKWQIGRLTKSTVSHTTHASPTLVKSSKFQYNTRGLLSEEIANYGTSLALKKSYKYDGRGNKIEETLSGQGVLTATTKFTYSSDGKFQTKVTNAMGHSEYKTYDARFGTIKSHKDATGLSTTWKYDGMGRKIEERRADGTVSRWYHKWYRASMNQRYVYYVEHSASGRPNKYTFYDGFGRETTEYTTTLKNKRLRTILKYYNAKGELYKEALPYIEGVGTIGYIRTTYDKYGRVTTVSKPGPNHATQTYRTSYSNFVTTVTNPKGQKKQTVKNALDETTSITDAYGTYWASTMRYYYDSMGNLLQTTDNSGNKIIMKYDTVGNKYYMSDPDLGIWNYRYNAAGKLTVQWSGKYGSSASKNYTYKNYDKLGRLHQTNTYDRKTYVTKGNAYHSYNFKRMYYDGKTGRLNMTYASTRLGSKDWNAEYIKPIYDSLGRVKQTQKYIYGRGSYNSYMTYDSYSRPHTMTYPNGYKITNHYSYGILDSVTGSDGKVHYKINNINAFGDVEDATYANGVRTVIGHDNAGFVGNIRSGQNGRWYAGNVHQVYYHYDILGNVAKRNDYSISGKYIRDTFTYGSHNRIKTQRTSSTVAGSYLKSKDYHFDRIGNMTYQTGVGSYTYYSSSPHAVRKAGNKSYSYDEVGNMTMRKGYRITYNPLNKPAVMNTTTYNKPVKFFYGIGDQRFIKDVGTKRTYYVGKSYEEEKDGYALKQICYINIGGKTVGTHTEEKSTYYAKTSTKYNVATYNHYFHTDALGSLSSITDDKGKVIERRSYEPYGQIRAMDYGTNNNSISNIVNESTRAFTGHEQIKEISGLIHMNARVYDSDIGRFLSADTIIQDPYDSQSYNRYAYVRNNPLKYTDPTGHSWFSKMWKKVKKHIRTIAAIVVGVVIAVYAPALLQTYLGVAKGLATAVTTGALAGAASGAILTRSFSGAMKGALFGALSAGAANMIGHGTGVFAKVRSYGSIAKATLHGLSRMAIAKLQYGSGKGSFLSGLAGSILGGYVAKNFSQAHIAVKTTIAAIAGGTASAIGGGKFANGAMGGAFIMLFNDLANTYPSKDKMYKVSHSEWKSGNKGMYKTLMVNGADTGRISAFNAYSSGSSDQWLYDLNIQIDRGTLMTLASLGLITGGAVSTGGVSLGFWVTGLALDTYSVYENNGDLTYGTASVVGNPYSGRVGAILAIGATLINAGRDD